jgi:fatty-acid peroxygenase
MADLAWRLWRDGYRALPEERARHDGADTFETRLLGRRALVVRGPAGARLFYDTSVIRRYDAIPAPLASLLFGAGAVHGLDDAEHAARKSMFLGLLTPERIAPLVTAVERELARRAARWRGRVAVFDELVEVYGTAVLPWAGISCSRRRAARLARRLARIVDGFGGVPTAYARGWAARIAANRWARRLVESVRIGETIPPAGSVLAVIAGSDLPASVAAVELINVLRPTVAVAGLARSSRWPWPSTGSGASCSATRSGGWRSRTRSAAATRSCRPSRGGYGATRTLSATISTPAIGWSSTWSAPTTTRRLGPIRRTSCRAGSPAANRTPTNWCPRVAATPAPATGARASR